ncbi:glycoside hydrolase family 3 protein [Paenibacillus sp. 1P07SE]|uniref:glycoside hydrolase family 3 protein n=1 Tax=Paenibacillus sp. 1P07SE TaxID=3132209 RepID=UPI0039A67DAE
MKFTIKPSDTAAKAVGKMSFRQLLNQVCCPTFGRVKERLEDYGALFFHPMDRQELVGHIGQFKSACAIPPFIVSDLECGAGNMVLGATRFPYMMGLSQTNDPELAYQTGAIAARESGAIGYNWTFSPVADLAHDPDSPVVSMRSAGHEPEHTVKMVSAYMRGLQDHGMMATIKHFPGDGWGSYDHHLTTPVLQLDRESWRQGPGEVFKRLIDEGAMAVMPGHIALPAFDEPDPETGLYPPATISRKLLIELLRKELGFEGLIVSDAVEMGGLVGYMNYYDACALTLENGCDCLLFPRMDEHFYTEMERRATSGMLTMEALQDRARRIVALKEQLGMLDERPVAAVRELDPDAHRRTAEQVAARSITVVRDRQGLIPATIGEETRVLHAVIMNNHDRNGELYARLKQELEKHTPHVTQWIDPGPDALFTAMRDRDYDLVVCSIGSRLSYGLNVVRLHDEVARNMMGGWTKLGVPIIFVSHFHPFVHKEYEASIDTIINTYGDIDCTAELLIEGIAGLRTLTRSLHAHD